MNRSVLFELVFIVLLATLYSVVIKKKKANYEFCSLDYTNALRGIAILMVYLQHTMGALGSRFFTPLGGGGVAIFLIISGFGLSESYKKKGLKGYWKKKILHVFIPWILVYFFFQFNYSRFDIWNVLGNITLIDPIPWYLQYLLLWYVVFYITHKIYILERYKYLIYAIVAICVFFFWGDLQAEQSITFIIGVVMSHYLPMIKNSPKKKMQIFVLSMLLLAILSLGVKQIQSVRACFDNEILFRSIQLCLKVSLALFVIFVLQYIKEIVHNSFVQFTGKISYELYLVHLWVTPVIFTNCNIENTYLYIVLFLLSTYIICYLFNYLNTKLIMKL